LPSWKSAKESFLKKLNFLKIFPSMTFLKKSKV